MRYTRHKTLFLALGVIVAIVGLTMWALLPLYQNTSDRLRKIAVKNKEREEITNRVSLLSQLDQNVLAERVATLDAALPPRKDVLLYLAAINGLSSELGLEFGGIDLAPGVLTEATGSANKNKTSKLGLESLESEVKVRGPQESIYAFLRAVEEVLPLMEIKDIKVTVTANEQYSLSLTMGMLWAKNNVQEVKGQVTLFGEEEEKYFRQLSSFRRYPPIISQVSEASESAKIDVFTPVRLQP